MHKHTRTSAIFNLGSELPPPPHVVWTGGDCSVTRSPLEQILCAKTQSFWNSAVKLACPYFLLMKLHLSMVHSMCKFGLEASTGPDDARVVFYKHRACAKDEHPMIWSKTSLANGLACSIEHVPKLSITWFYRKLHFELPRLQHWACVKIVHRMIFK